MGVILFSAGGGGRGGYSKRPYSPPLFFMEPFPKYDFGWYWLVLNDGWKLDPLWIGELLSFVFVVWISEIQISTLSEKESCRSVSSGGEFGCNWSKLSQLLPSPPPTAHLRTFHFIESHLNWSQLSQLPPTLESSPPSRPFHSHPILCLIWNVAGASPTQPPSAHLGTSHFIQSHLNWCRKLLAHSIYVCSSFANPGLKYGIVVPPISLLSVQ